MHPDQYISLPPSIKCNLGLTKPTMATNELFSLYLRMNLRFFCPLFMTRLIRALSIFLLKVRKLPAVSLIKISSPCQTDSCRGSSSLPDAISHAGTSVFVCVWVSVCVCVSVCACYSMDSCHIIIQLSWHWSGPSTRGDGWGQMSKFELYRPEIISPSLRHY